MLKLATTTSDFGHYVNQQIEGFRYIKECGFDYIDYNFCRDYNRKDGFYSEKWEDYLAQVKNEVTALGLTFVQAHAPMGRPFVNMDEMIRATLHSIDISHELGIQNIVVHSGYNYDLSREETFRINKEFFLPLCERAKEYGMNVLCENFNIMVDPRVYWIDNATDLNDFIEYVDHPNLHACWDAGHANLQKMPQREELKILGHHVKALHIQDNMGDAWDDAHMCPYFGTLNLDDLMSGLREIGYAGYFTFEVGRMPFYNANRAEYREDTRLVRPPLAIKMMAEKMMHAIGEHILNTSCDW